MIFTIEGNIGAGKSSLLKLLEQVKFDKEHVIVFEPIDEWMRAKPVEGGQSIFEMYYDDKQRYGFMFQMFALQTRVKHMAEIIANNPGRVIVCERCHLTDCEIFANMLHDQKIINDAEYFVYKSWYEFMIETVRPHVHGIIYLRVDPEVCVKRILKRNRQGEENISTTYIQQLHIQHEAWLAGKEQIEYPILDIDGNINDIECIDIGSIIEFINHNTLSS
jgi:deoxyadenosine/deoxycytidine kinase